MPSEAQLKAQMQVAIAKKKQAAAKASADAKPSIPEVVEAEKPEIVAKPAVEVVNGGTVINSTPHAPDTSATSLIFFGHTIRFALHKGEVYFAVIDLLPLSKIPDYANKFIDFKNNPKTKAVAEPLIQLVSFIGQNGTEKIEGATAPNILAIFRALNFTAPGPMGRWLTENATLHRQK